MPATYTPLRYPGGKTKIYDFAKSLIEINGYGKRTYAEVFAGGAGLGIKLLLKGDVPSIIINDYDRAVFCIWKAIVEKPSELCAFIDSSNVTIDEWKQHRDTYRNQEDIDDFELGKAAFFLNRTNVSGIIDGGVIGGINQTGPYKIDARFKKEGLKNKIKAIAARQDDIEIYRNDCEVFIDDVLNQKDKCFTYFDPPYVQKGPGLYHSSFDEDKHRSLSSKILSCQIPWFATYDDNPLIDELYGEHVKEVFSIGYSAHHASVGKEKMILAECVKTSNTEDEVSLN